MCAKSSLIRTLSCLRSACRNSNKMNPERRKPFPNVKPYGNASKKLLQTDPCPPLPLARKNTIIHYSYLLDFTNNTIMDMGTTELIGNHTAAVAVGIIWMPRICVYAAYLISISIYLVRGVLEFLPFCCCREKSFHFSFIFHFLFLFFFSPSIYLHEFVIWLYSFIFYF